VRHIAANKDDVRPAHGAIKWRRGSSATSRHYVGSERVSAAQILGSSLPPGTSAMSAYPAGLRLNPNFIGTRLPIEARLFAKFMFKKIRFEFTPALSPANAGATGGMLMGFNADPDAPQIELGTDGVNAIASWEPNVVSGNVFSRMQLDVDLDLPTQDPLFCDSTTEQRFSSQGVFSMIMTATTPGTVPPQYGDVYVVYEVELSEPNLPASLNPSLVIIAKNVSSGVTGDAAFGSASYVGSTELMTQLATPVSVAGGAAANWLLNSPSAGNQRSNWEVNFHSYLLTGAATVTLGPRLVLTGGAPVSGWTIDANMTAGTAVAAPAGYLSQSASGLLGAFSNRPVAANVVNVNSFRFSTSDVSMLAFIVPTVSAGLQDILITIHRVDDDFQPRTHSNAPFLSVRQVGNFDRFVSQFEGNRPALISAVNEYVRGIDMCQIHPSTGDYDMLDLCHAALGTNRPLVRLTTAQPLFLPLLAGAAAWLLAKFGPTIASTVLGYGVHKLEEYAKGEPEKPVRRRRKRDAEPDDLPEI